MMRIPNRALASFAAVGLMLAFELVSLTRCQAALVIEVQDQLLTSGGLGFVDVFIYSTGTDFLNSASYTVEIRKFSGEGTLRFQPTATQSNSEQADGNYLFAGDVNPLNFSAFRKDPDVLQLAGGDATSSGDDVVLDGTNRLLARLEIEHEIPDEGKDTATGVFHVFFIDNLSNEFINTTDEDVTIDQRSYTDFGTITVAPTAVPEPTSVALLFLVVTALAIIRQTRLRKEYAIAASILG